MTTNHHTPIPFGSLANSDTLNAPLSELDTTVSALSTQQATNTGHITDLLADVLDHETRVESLENEFPAASGVPTEYLDGEGNWTVPAGTGAGIDGHVVQDEGVDLPQRAKLNFVGAGVTVTDDVGGTTVEIPGATGGIQSVVAGSNISIDTTDPENPVINASAIQSIVAGTGISVDVTDPENPVVSTTGGSASASVLEIQIFS